MQSAPVGHSSGWTVIRTAALFIGLGFSLLPIAWLVLSSFKEQRDIFSMPPVWSFSPTLAQYKVALSDLGIGHSVLNSGLIATGVSGLSLVLGSLAGYAFARYRLPGGTVLLSLVLITRMVPPIVTIIPFFLLYQSLGLLDTRVAVILAHSSMAIPLVIWLMRAFFMGIPRELEEAGMVDGCSEVGTLMRITGPLSISGLAVAGVLTFIDSWNEFIMAYILTTNHARTLPVAIASLIAERSTEYGPMFASGVLAMLPIFAAMVVVQRHGLRGLTAGALR